MQLWGWYKAVEFALVFILPVQEVWNHFRKKNCGDGSVRGALPSLRNLLSSRSESMHSNSQFLVRAHPFLLDSFQYLRDLCLGARRKRGVTKGCE